MEHSSSSSAGASIGVRLSPASLQAIHQTWADLESSCLVCKVLGNRLSARQLWDYLLVRFGDSDPGLVNVFPLGSGCFRLQFKSPPQADSILQQSPYDFHRGIAYFYRWRQGLDLSSLGKGLTVTARFPGLLPELVPYISEISACLGYVLPADCQDSYSEDRTATVRLILHHSLVLSPPRFLSLPTQHGGEYCQRVFFIGLPGHCFVCGKLGHLAAGCTRRRVPPEVRQRAVDLEQGQPVSSPPRAEVSSPQRSRSDAEKARRRESKKRRRTKARQVHEDLQPSIPPKVVKVYRRRVTPSTLASSSALPLASLPLEETPPVSSGVIIPILSEAAQDTPSLPLSDSSRRDLLPLSELSALYEKQFPPLNSSNSVRRSDRLRTKT